MSDTTSTVSSTSTRPPSPEQAVDARMAALNEPVQHVTNSDTADLDDLLKWRLRLRTMHPPRPAAGQA